MSEVKTVAIRRLKPNPHRDIEHYPIDREKVERLKQSIQSTKLWPNIVAREVSGEVEVAYGHHRVAALRDLFGEDKRVEVVMDDLDDSTMLRMMADENAEEYGSSFLLGTMEPIKAVILAYGAGTIALEKPASGAGARTDAFRCAPSFVRGDRGAPTTYTTQTVASFLGWLEPKGRAKERVFTALDALELVELGAAKASQFRGIGNEQAREIVRQAKLAYDAKVGGLREDAAPEVVKRVQSKAAEAARSVVTETTKAIREDKEPIRAVAVRARKEAAKTMVPPKKKQAPDISEAAVKLTDIIDGYLSDYDTNDSKLGQLTDAYSDPEVICATKAMNGLERSLRQLATRATNRADKLAKARVKREK